MPINHSKQYRFNPQRFELLVAKLNWSIVDDEQIMPLQDRIKQQSSFMWQLLSDVYSEEQVEGILVELLNTLLLGYSQRTNKLKQKDKLRSSIEPWYLSHKQVGMACYVDRFATDLNGLKSKIPYLKNLGITFLHLLPLYESPQGDNDGGYAVSNYRKVNPALGDMQMLRDLIDECELNGIHIVLDFIFNHTSDQHIWAKKAIAGEEKYQDFYFLFDDRKVPDQFDPYLREIFPHVRRGNFSYREDIKKWVWTTFNNYQWDLNYANPNVLCSVIEEMLFLANTGCDVLRLDALSFIWKDVGTNCESRPKAYKLISLLNRCLRIAAPSVIFKSEAIVHPDEVAKYISAKRCQLSYNPLLMGLLWSSLATQNTGFINQSLQHRFEVEPQCAWINYVRCHDDIGWFFDQGDAEAVNIQLDQHLSFLNEFYTQKLSGEFPSGVSFQNDPSVDHHGVCGSLASLCGLEKAIANNDQEAINLSIKRINLLHSIILSIGGIPLIYSGDELALLNDYNYLDDDTKNHDARWVNRPRITAQAIELAKKSNTPQNRVYQALTEMITLRKHNSILGDARTEIVNTGNNHIFAYQRVSQDENALLAICNFSDLPQSLKLDKIHTSFCMDDPLDLITNTKLKRTQVSVLSLAAYQVMWLIN